MIDHIAIAAKVRELAERHPDHKADSQYFNSDHSPCCIVGHALFELGIPLPEKMTNGSGWRRTSPLRDLGSPEVLAAREFVADVQGVQDEDHTWGEAVAAVDGP